MPIYQKYYIIILTVGGYTYEIKYEGNGATGGATATSTHEYDKARQITKNGFSRINTVSFNSNGGSTCNSQTATYTFGGWKSPNSAGFYGYSAESCTTSITANNTIIPDASYVLNLATSGTISLTAQWSNGKITLPTATRIGHTLAGWYKESSLTNFVGNAGDDYSPSENITLYAKWDRPTCKVTLVSKVDEENIVSISMDAQYNSDMPEIVIPYRDAEHNFGGYFTEENGYGKQYYTA